MNIPFFPLMTNPLFKGLSVDELQAFHARIPFSLHGYEKDEIVAFEGESCEAIGLVVSGSVHAQKTFADGRCLIIDTLHAGSSFGEVIVFSDHNAYPATIITHEPARIVYLNKDGAIRLGADFPVFQTNLMRLLSNKILMLNKKIKSLSFQSLRQKITFYILEEFNKQKNLHLTIAPSRDELALLLGMPRPSLSRELAAMKADGLIDYDRKKIFILNFSALQSLLEN